MQSENTRHYSPSHGDPDMQQTGDSTADGRDLEELIDDSLDKPDLPGALVQFPVPPRMDEGDQVSESKKKPAVSVDGPSETPTPETFESSTAEVAPKDDGSSEMFESSTAEVAQKDCLSAVPTSPPAPMPAKEVSTEVPARKLVTPCRATPKQHDPPSSGVSGAPSVQSSPMGSGTPSSQRSPIPESEMPLLDDPNAAKPIPGQIRLTENAINLRMHRLMKVDSKGNSRVSAEIRKQYHNKKGKLRLQQIFQSCGYEPDWLFRNFSIGIVVCFGPNTMQNIARDR